MTALIEEGLELTEDVELSLLNSPLLQAAFHGVGMASADRAQVGLLKNPSLSAVPRFSTSGGAVEIGGGLFASLLDLWRVHDRERVAEQVLELRILEPRTRPSSSPARSGRPTSTRSPPGTWSRFERSRDRRRSPGSGRSAGSWCRQTSREETSADS